jgi:NTP pyrophosphatase (non-canonical NTP hydrolase)
MRFCFQPVLSGDSRYIFYKMSDANTTLETLKHKILAFVDERDWRQFHSPKNLSMAIAAEAAELMEHFLWAETETSREVLQDPVKNRKVREEVADILIYTLEFANIAEIDLVEAVEAKMTENARRYPVAKSKGKPLKYDEL